MKRVILLLVFFSMLFVSAVENPTVTGIGGGDVEAIEGAIENLPIDPDTGKPDFDKYDIETRADERIKAINKYVGPITKVLFGVELTLSWLFVFSVLFWLLLIEVILMPVSEIFDWNLWVSLLGSGIIASISMQGFGKNFVIMINSLVTQWYIAITFVVLAFIIGTIYSVFMKSAGAWVKAQKEMGAKKKTSRDRALLGRSAELEMKRLKGN